MATKAQVESIFAQLRDDLQAKIDSGDYNAALNALIRLHLAVAGSLREFQQRPRYGDSSPAYDAAFSAGNDGLQVARALKPRDNIAQLQSAVVNAVRELQKVTAPVVLVGSLRIRRHPAVVARADGPRVGRAMAVDPSPPADPAEPYLASLAKLFPAEALSALLLVLAIKEDYRALRMGLVALIALTSVILRCAATWDPVKRRPDALAVLASLVAFLIYAAAMLVFGPFIYDAATTRLVATVFAVLLLALLTGLVRSRAT
jgi:hypothetical protein